MTLHIPITWTDHLGRTWEVPTIIGRLKCGQSSGYRALREFVIARDKTCRWCGTTEDLLADHIVSRKNGGSHHPSNLQALCARCNARKVSLVDTRFTPNAIARRARRN